MWLGFQLVYGSRQGCSLSESHVGGRRTEEYLSSLCVPLTQPTPSSRRMPHPREETHAERCISFPLPLSLSCPSHNSPLVKKRVYSLPDRAWPSQVEGVTALCHWGTTSLSLQNSLMHCSILHHRRLQIWTWTPYGKKFWRKWLSSGN